jgi:hypothetical protein
MEHEIGGFNFQMKYIRDQIGFFTNFGGKLVASLNLMILTPT